MSISPLKVPRLILMSVLTAGVIGILGVAAAAQQQHITGSFSDGATYVIDYPANWNGSLVLYSHGYVAPGSPNPAYDYGDGDTAYYLFVQGYAFAGSSYASTGWAVQQAIPDQIATLEVFVSLFGTPTTTIAWGHSMGGLITAALVQQYPARFNAALPMCGVVAGSVGFWNEALDAAFAFNTLLAGNSLQVVDIANPAQNYDNAAAFLAAAQATPQGRARVALVAALDDIPGWFDPSSPEPAPTDYATRETNQFYWLAYSDFLFAFDLRAELEGRAGGNPSFNSATNYAMQLQHSADYAEVQALYSAAGLNLNADLATLKKAQRINADPGALSYLTDNIIFDGQIHVPVLTMHTTGDGLVPVEDEQAYSKAVSEAHDSAFLKEIFVHRAGHCEFTPAETITAFETILTRLKTGKWEKLAAPQLNGEALGLGSTYNVLDINGSLVDTAPEFLTYQPPQFLRIYDTFTQ